MVVVPLSTIGSWERELAKWAPGLEVLAYNGSQEARAIIRKWVGRATEGMDHSAYQVGPPSGPTGYILEVCCSVVVTGGLSPLGL